MNIYRYLPFTPNAFGHGGEKRAQQISELLEKLEIKWEPLKLDDYPGRARLNRFLALFFNFTFIKSLDLNFKSLKQYWTFSSNIYYIKRQIKHLNIPGLIIYEHSSGVNWLIPILLKQKGYKIIAIPHNLETLVPNQRSQFTDNENPAGFFEEIKVLQSADLVLTISREEDWLLNLFGINALYYPYVPTTKELNLLKNISYHRETRETNYQYLILGTAANPPTMLGMTELISNLVCKETEDMIFHIAGFKTETLSEKGGFPKRFIFHGTIDLNLLHKLYKEVNAVIIHQTPSSGALTKIPELIMAGIPVLANNFAARSFFNMKGLYVYKSFDELRSVLGNMTGFIHIDNSSLKNDIDDVSKAIKTLSDQVE